MKYETTFTKFDNTRQIVYGVVYEPLRGDSQGDWMIPEEIEKTAHTFTAKGYVDQIDRNHDGRPSGARVVESFIARKGDPVFPEGAWAIGVKTPDDVWAQIQAGELNGFSLYGAGRRIEKSLRGDPSAKFEIRDLDVTAVSLVKRAANKRTFAIKKQQDNSMDELLKTLNTIATQMQTLAERQAEMRKHFTTEVSKTLEAAREDAELAADEWAYRLDLTGTVPPPLPRTVRKAQAEVHARDSAAIARHRRRIESLHGQLERVWAGELMHDDPVTLERELRREIQKSEIELEALGHYDRARIDDPGRNAFFQRGGVSGFLDIGLTTIDEQMGVRRSPEVRKAEAEIDLSSDLII